MSQFLIFLSPSQPVRMLTGMLRSPWERFFFNKGPLCFELLVHRWFLTFLLFETLPLFEIFISKHQDLQLWALVVLPEQYTLLRKRCFCSFLAPGLWSPGLSSTKVAWVSLQSCCPSHSLWWEDRKRICSRPSGHHSPVPKRTHHKCCVNSGIRSLYLELSWLSIWKMGKLSLLLNADTLSKHNTATGI